MYKHNTKTSITKTGLLHLKAMKYVRINLTEDNTSSYPYHLLSKETLEKLSSKGVVKI